MSLGPHGESSFVERRCSKIRQDVVAPGIVQSVSQISSPLSRLRCSKGKQCSCRLWFGWKIAVSRISEKMNDLKTGIGESCG
jgi:hypothetical protein